MPSESLDIRSLPFTWGLAIAAVAIALIIAVGGPFGLAGVAAIAGLLVTAFIHPFIPFTTYFAALFFENTTIPGIPVSVNQIVAPLFLLSVIIYAVRGKTLPLRFALLPLLVIVAAYYGINGLFGEDAENGLLYSRYVVIYLIIAICIAVTMSRERSILTLIWIIVGLTGIAAAAGVVEAFQKNLLGKFTGHWGYDLRVQGTAANPIAFGWNMVYAFPFAFLLFAESDSRYMRGLAMFLGMLILTAATLTFNRQTFVVIAVSVALCSFLFAYRNRKLFLGFMSVMGVIAAFTVLPMIVKRFLTVADLSKDFSYLERRDSFLIGLQMVEKYPLTGIGFGSFPKVWAQYIPPDYSTYFAQYRGAQAEKFLDLGFMQVLVETGIIGLLLYLTLIITIFVVSFRYRRAAIRAGDTFAQNLSSTVIVTIVFLGLTSMIQDTFLYTRTWIFYGIAMLLDPNVLPLKRTVTDDEVRTNLAAPSA